jgi:prephenate dehydrogenase
LQTVAILGTGLIGGSLGLALRSLPNPPFVIGWDRCSDSVQQAVARGALDQAVDLQAAARADVIVFAVPVAALEPLAKDIAPLIRPDAAFTDVTSVKANVSSQMESILGRRFVAGHPMAGSERSGIQAARADLFQGAAWAITPTSETDPAAVETISRIVESVGARPVVCSPEEHDHWVSILSHVPHVLAYGLAHIANESLSDEGRRLAGPSFRDITRVAASNPELWSGILMANRHEVLAGMSSFQGWWTQVEAALSRGDRDGLKQLLAGSQKP